MKCPTCHGDLEPVVHGRDVSALFCPACNTISHRRLPDSLGKPKQ